MTHPFIRAAQPSDLPQLRTLIAALSAYHGDTATIRLEQLQNAFFGPCARAHAILAEASGTLIGYAGITDVSSLHEECPRFDIHHLFIVEGHRSKGIGRALIGAATDLARERNALRLTIGTDPANTGAQAAYRAMGLDEQTEFAPRFHIALD